MCMGMTLPQYQYRYTKTKIEHQFMWIFRASKSHGDLINIRVLVNLRTLNPHANFESEYIPFRLEYPQLLNHQAPLMLTAQLSALQRSLSLSTVVNIIPFRLTPGSGKIILSPERITCILCVKILQAYTFYFSLHVHVIVRTHTKLHNVIKAQWHCSTTEQPKIVKKNSIKYMNILSVFCSLYSI